ncbi:GPW/gp25 family protein [Cupriavidus plantarum]|uniref:GPW/gp25 family protein n=1 Tax=Cupriavidus plantarum TaxID=942865 RepID=UPI001FC9048C|nr:GPW/gp25 family protein [Cupriavidus plantarum]
MAHIWQSVRDILTTQIGTRTMRRSYGSDVPSLIDQPLNGVTRLRVMSAAVAAIVKWEPRISVDRLTFSSDAAGALTVDIEASRVDGPRTTPVSPTTISLREARA